MFLKLLDSKGTSYIPVKITILNILIIIILLYGVSLTQYLLKVWSKPFSIEWILIITFLSEPNALQNLIIQLRWSIYTIWSDLDNLNHTLSALNEAGLTLIYRFQERDLFWKSWPVYLCLKASWPSKAVVTLLFYLWKCYRTFQQTWNPKWRWSRHLYSTILIHKLFYGWTNCHVYCVVPGSHKCPDHHYYIIESLLLLL